MNLWRSALHTLQVMQYSMHFNNKHQKLKTKISFFKKIKTVVYNKYCNFEKFTVWWLIWKLFHNIDALKIVCWERIMLSVSVVVDVAALLYKLWIILYGKNYYLWRSGGKGAPFHGVLSFKTQFKSDVCTPYIKTNRKTVLFSSDIAGQIIIYTLLCQNAPMKIDGENCHRVFTTLSILMNILFY